MNSSVRAQQETYFFLQLSQRFCRTFVILLYLIVDFEFVHDRDGLA